MAVAEAEAGNAIVTVLDEEKAARDEAVLEEEVEVEVVNEAEEAEEVEEDKEEAPALVVKFNRVQISSSCSKPFRR